MTMRSLFVCVLTLSAALSLCAVQEQVAGTDDKPNESRAVGMVRTLNTAEAAYQSTYPEVGFACTLGQLGESASGKNTAEAAGLISKKLTSGQVEGYKIAV